MQQQQTYGDLFQRAQQLKLQRDHFEQVQKPQAAAQIALTDAEATQRQNENKLFAMKAQAGQIDAQIAAETATAQATTSKAKFDKAVADEMSAYFAPSAPGAPASGLDADIADLQSVDPTDPVTFGAKLAAFTKKVAPYEQANPNAAIVIGKRLAPLLAANASAMSTYQGTAQIWGRQQLPFIDALKTPEEFQAFMNADPKNFRLALAFNPDFNTAVRNKAAKLQEQQFEMEKQKTQRDEEFRLGQEKLNRETEVKNDEFGISGNAPNTTASEKARSTLSSLGTLKDAMDGLYSVAEAVQSSPVGGRLDPAVAAEAVVKKQQLVSALGQLQSNGFAASAETIDELNKLIPNGVEIGSLATMLRGGQGKRLLATLDSLGREAHARTLATADLNNLKISDRKKNPFAHEKGDAAASGVAPDGSKVSGKVEIHDGKKYLITPDGKAYPLNE